MNSTRQLLLQHRLFAAIVAAGVAAYLAFAFVVISKRPPIGGFAVLAAVGSVVFMIGYLLGREYFDKLLFCVSRKASFPVLWLA